MHRLFKALQNISLIALSAIVFFSCTSTNKEYYPNGKVKVLAEFKGGKQHGAYHSYFQNGAVEKEGHFTEGQPDGQFNEYYRNGNIKAINFFKNGLQDSISKSFFEDGQLGTEAHFKNGKQSGLAKSFSSSGKLKTEQLFVDGKANGPCKQYFNNGQIERMEIYKDDVSVYTEEYDENGKFLGDKRKIWAKGPSKIKLGEEFVAVIESSGPVTNYEYALCELKVTGRYELSPAKSTDGKFTFKYKPTKTGIVNISGQYILYIKGNVSPTKFEISFTVE